VRAPHARVDAARVLAGYYSLALPRSGAGTPFRDALASPATCLPGGRKLLQFASGQCQPIGCRPRYHGADPV